MKCPICNKNRNSIKFPIIESSLGLVFCNSCYSDVKDMCKVYEETKVFTSYQQDDLVTLLKAVAAVRQHYLDTY